MWISDKPQCIKDGSKMQKSRRSKEIFKHLRFSLIVAGENSIAEWLMSTPCFNMYLMKM